ncbi:MAG TPA: lipopolysaccharide biosynthesis protein [Kofleriaceae bacterium]|jgi:O-antigen/teichoic acid export membrane protein|nr:lipopolysaccharide biosynthesis protein [Kofleriaceae bacterium]
MSEAKQASKEAGIYAYSRIVASVFILLTLALGARLYSSPEFEYIGALLLLYESAVALGSLGLADAVFYYIGKQPADAPLVVRQTSFLLLCVAGPVVAIVCLFGLTMHGKIPLAPALPWLAATILIELPTQPAVNQLLAVRRARLASGLYVLFASFRPIAVLLPALTGIDITYVPIVLAITGTTRLVAHLTIMKRIFPLRSGETRKQWLVPSTLWSIVGFAFPAGVAILGGKLNPQIDKYVVHWVRGTHDFNLYTAAAWELPLITLIPYAIGAVMQARYVRLYEGGQKRELRELWLNTVRKTGMLVLPLTAMMIALANEAVVVVSGERYAGAAILFQIFTLTMLQRVTAYGPILQSIGETRSLLVTNSMLIIANLALSYPFTKVFGFPGAAIATVSATIPPLLFTLWRISIKFHCKMSEVMPYRHYFATLGLSSALAVGLFCLRPYLGHSAGVRLGLGAAIYVVTFTVVARVVGLIKREDLMYLRDWLSLRMLRH